MHNYLKPLKLTGGVQLPNRIIPGPMEGVMHPLFCATMHRMELLDSWITPFIRISNAVPSHAVIKRFTAPFTESGLPVVVQLMGSDPKLMAEGATRIHKLGVAGVNLNFACPSKKVLRSNGGGSMLDKPQLIAEIINSIYERCPDFSVSIKIRAGIRDPSDMECVIPIATACGIDFIIFHYRTVYEMYSEIADGHQRLSKAVDLAGSVPVIGSGDIHSFEDAVAMFEQTNCSGVAVARGLTENPLLIKNIKLALSGKKQLSNSEGKLEYFNTMLAIANENKERYWRRSSIIETTKLLWGKHHPMFEQIKQKLN